MWPDMVCMPKDSKPSVPAGKEIDLPYAKLLVTTNHSVQEFETRTRTETRAMRVNQG